MKARKREEARGNKGRFSWNLLFMKVPAQCGTRDQQKWSGHGFTRGAVDLDAIPQAGRTNLWFVASC